MASRPSGMTRTSAADSPERQLRPFQGYLAKVPRDLFDALPQLREVREIAAKTRPTPKRPVPAAERRGLGAEYRSANPDARSARREPFSVDPDLVDRAARRSCPHAGHARR